MKPLDYALILCGIVNILGGVFSLIRRADPDHLGFNNSEIAQFIGMGAVILGVYWYLDVINRDDPNTFSFLLKSGEF
jgi:hypothetical protein